MASGANGRKTFRLILIKPSHYDDDGYVIQWLRSPIPANSLACLYGLALDAQARDVRKRLVVDQLSAGEFSLVLTLGEIK